jgi:hypothetical protein
MKYKIQAFPGLVTEFCKQNHLKVSLERTNIAIIANYNIAPGALAYNGAII